MEKLCRETSNNQSLFMVIKSTEKEIRVESKHRRNVNLHMISETRWDADHCTKNNLNTAAGKTNHNSTQTFCDQVQQS